MTAEAGMVGVRDDTKLRAGGGRGAVPGRATRKWPKGTRDGARARA